MSSLTIEQLTAPGGPFELETAIINNMECRVFKNTPSSLTQIYKALDQFADHDLAVYDGHRLSYKDASGQAAELAKILSERFNIQKCDRVAIVMRNTPEWLVSFIAITSLGAIPALVNSRGAPEEIAYSIVSTNCKLIVTETKSRQGLEQSEASTVPLLCFELDQRFTLSGDGSPIKPKPYEAPLICVDSEPEDIAMILFTAGTTGRPKGALLTHRGVLTGLKTNQYSGMMIGIQMAERYGIDFQTLIANRPPTSVLLMFPLFHVSGCQAVFLSSLMQGGKLVMMSKWNGDQALRLVEQERITMFPGVPAMYWDMLRSPILADVDLSSMTNVSVAGQATPLPLFDAIKRAFPQAIIGCGYGMTETNGAISLNVGESLITNPTSVGQAVATTDIKLVKEDGSRAKTGERGEICVRGATVMLAYDNQPEANEKSFREGWYYTGDIGQFDEHNNLYVVDRSTEMVISSGENIYCAEVERVLNQAPGVMQSTTFGVSDERLGERLIALVYLHSDEEVTVKEIISFTSTKLAAYKIPAELYICDHPIPTNAMGKVLKAEARKVYEDIRS